MEALRIDDLDEDDADGDAEDEAEAGADQRPDGAFGGDDGEDLAPGQTEMDPRMAAWTVVWASADGRSSRKDGAERGPVSIG